MQGKNLLQIFRVMVLASLLIPATVTARPVEREGASLEFIGQATFPSGYIFQDTRVGGLSGIDYDADTDTYFAISDDRAIRDFARFYQLTIDLSDGQLNDGDVEFISVTEILDENGQSFSPRSLDPESIRVLPFPKLLMWTSEGNAKNGISPFVRVMTSQGQPVSAFEVPEKYVPTATTGVRNNLAFESLTFNHNRTKLITATENALIRDGEAATLTAGSPVRVLVMSMSNGQAEKEFIYMTDPVPYDSKPAKEFKTNGLVELLTVGENKMLAIERGFSVGTVHTIKLYLTTSKGATNVLDLNSISTTNFNPMQKELLLDLDALTIPLDNIEGVTFGPDFPGGAKSLILISDNNFNPSQFTQVLAFKFHIEDE